MDRLNNDVFGEIIKYVGLIGAYRLMGVNRALFLRIKALPWYVCLKERSGRGRRAIWEIEQGQEQETASETDGDVYDGQVANQWSERHECWTCRKLVVLRHLIKNVDYEVPREFILDTILEVEDDPNGCEYIDHNYAVKMPYLASLALATGNITLISILLRCSRVKGGRAHFKMGTRHKYVDFNYLLRSKIDYLSKVNILKRVVNSDKFTFATIRVFPIRVKTPEDAKFVGEARAYKILNGVIITNYKYLGRLLQNWPPVNLLADFHIQDLVMAIIYSKSLVLLNNLINGGPAIPKRKAPAFTLGNSDIVWLIKNADTVFIRTFIDYFHGLFDESLIGDSYIEDFITTAIKYGTSKTVIYLIEKAHPIVAATVITVGGGDVSFGQVLKELVEEGRVDVLYWAQKKGYLADRRLSRVCASDGNTSGNSPSENSEIYVQGTIFGTPDYIYFLSPRSEVGANARSSLIKKYECPLFDDVMVNYLLGANVNVYKINCENCFVHLDFESARKLRAKYRPREPMRRRFKDAYIGLLSDILPL